MKSYVCIFAMSLLLASTAMAGLAGDTYDFSTAKTGSVTISPLGSGGSFTVPAGPSFCVGPNADNCATSGLFGLISFNSSQIVFNFSGSTFGTSGSFILNLTNFVPANILNVTYNSGALLSGTFGLTSFSSSSMVFTGSIPEGSFNAVGGLQIIFDVVTAAAPTVTKSFSPNQVTPGGTSTLTVKITNPNATAALNNVAFTDTYPAGVVTASPSNLTSTCGGVAVAAPGSLSLSGGSVAGGGNCSVTVSVAGVTEGIKTNSVTVTSNFGTGTATATLTVATPPSLTKSFGNSLTLLPGGTTGLTFTLKNPNSALTLTGLAFSDTLPVGLLVSNPSVVTGICDGGTITAVAGGNLITLTGATLAAGANCTFSVNVTAAGSEIGQVINTTSTVTSNEALPGAAASASIFIGNAFEVRYASNLGIGDSLVNVTDTGTSSTLPAFPTQNGNICVNVYTFSPDEQLISCCTCPVTPDGLNSLSARNDLISNTLTPGVPTSIVTKVLASTGPVCNASTVGLGGNVLATGLAAWGTTIHALPVTAGSPATTYGTTETRFTPSTLSIAELQRITTLCGFIQSNGSGFGICKSCRLGGLAASEQ